LCVAHMHSAFSFQKAKQILWQSSLPAKILSSDPAAASLDTATHRRRHGNAFRMKTLPINKWIMQPLCRAAHGRRRRRELPSYYCLGFGHTDINVVALLANRIGAQVLCGGSA